MTDPGTADLAARALSQLTGGDTAALESYRLLVTLEPETADHWFNLGYLERAHRNFDAALAAYAEALAHGIAGPHEVHLNRALVWSEDLLDPQAAEADLRVALALEPRFVAAWLNLGNLHEDAGNADAAATAYEAALRIDPHNGRGLARLAAIAVHRRDTAAIFDRLLGAVADKRRSLADDVEIRFAIGHVLDAMGEYDLAFEAYLSANASDRQSAPPRYSAHDEAELVRASRALFPTGAAAPNSRDGAPQPIFICGLFRSGSTLFEQLLGRHSAITRGGELEMLPWLVQNRLQPWPDAIAGLGADDFAALRTAYLDDLPPPLREAQLFTDKRPDNFRYIGLIKAMFPHARIIHTTRRPIDNLLSMWFLNFGQGVPYASDFDDLLAHFRNYQALMAHWRQHFGADILDIDYDALVASPDVEMRRALAFLGLQWEPDCTVPDASANLIRTASVWQVRQPLHQRSSGRWQHYQSHIADLAAELSRIDVELPV
ncbi:MAG: sulfotransferase [Sandarakinorhabdus sp.]|nr:sulfotransferase [Sandarakinorhabdus sp.]